MFTSLVYLKLCSTVRQCEFCVCMYMFTCNINMVVPLRFVFRMRMQEKLEQLQAIAP